MGVVPLVFSSGAGAEMRQAMGIAVFSGMLGVTFFGLVFTPVFYVVIQSLVERRAVEKRPAASWPRSAPMSKATMILVSLGLAACASPGYQSSGVTVPQEFREGLDSAAAPRRKPASTRRPYRRRPRGDQGGHAILARAGRQHARPADRRTRGSNLDVRSAVARVRGARAVRAEAGLDLAPMITAGASSPGNGSPAPRSRSAAGRFPTRASGTAASTRRGSSTSSAGFVTSFRLRAPR